VEKYVRVRQATDENIIQCMRFVYWIPKATDTHSEYAVPLLLDGNIGTAKAPQYYFIHVRIFPALSSLFLHCNVVTGRL
jgi:hypothetical protein